MINNYYENTNNKTTPHIMKTFPTLDLSYFSEIWRHSMIITVSDGTKLPITYYEAVINPNEICYFLFYGENESCARKSVNNYVEITQPDGSIRKLKLEKDWKKNTSINTKDSFEINFNKIPQYNFGNQNENHYHTKVVKIVGVNPFTGLEICCYYGNSYGDISYGVYSNVYPDVPLAKYTNGPDTNTHPIVTFCKLTPSKSFFQGLLCQKPISKSGKTPDSFPLVTSASYKPLLGVLYTGSPNPNPQGCVSMIFTPENKYHNFSPIPTEYIHTKIYRAFSSTQYRNNPQPRDPGTEKEQSSIATIKILRKPNFNPVENINPSGETKTNAKSENTTEVKPAVNIKPSGETKTNAKSYDSMAVKPAVNSQRSYQSNFNPKEIPKEKLNDDGWQVVKNSKGKKTKDYSKIPNKETPKIILTREKEKTSPPVENKIIPAENKILPVAKPQKIMPETISIKFKNLKKFLDNKEFYPKCKIDFVYSTKEALTQFHLNENIKLPITAFIDNKNNLKFVEHDLISLEFDEILNEFKINTTGNIAVLELSNSLKVTGKLTPDWEIISPKFTWQPSEFSSVTFEAESYQIKDGKITICFLNEFKMEAFTTTLSKFELPDTVCDLLGESYMDKGIFHSNNLIKSEEKEDKKEKKSKKRKTEAEKDYYFNKSLNIFQYLIDFHSKNKNIGAANFYSGRAEEVRCKMKIPKSNINVALNFYYESGLGGFSKGFTWLRNSYKNLFKEEMNKQEKSNYDFFLSLAVLNKSHDALKEYYNAVEYQEYVTKHLKNPILTNKLLADIYENQARVHRYGIDKIIEMDDLKVNYYSILSCYYGNDKLKKLINLSMENDGYEEKFYQGYICHNLGLLIAKGIGVEKDAARSNEFFTEATEIHNFVLTNKVNCRILWQ